MFCARLEPDFPPPEDKFDAYYAEAKLEQENTERTQVTINIHNETSQSPEFNDKMSVRYFINIEELLSVGQTISDVNIEIYYDEQKSDHGQEVAVTGPFGWGITNYIYYYELDWSGYDIYGDRKIQIALIAKQGPGWKSYWDPTNDFSQQNIVADYAVTENIPFYLNGVKVFGNEPDPNSSSSSSTSSSRSFMSSSSSSISSSSVLTSLTVTYVIADEWEMDLLLM